jgi:predicted ArsR family transcriptional regulator
MSEHTAKLRGRPRGQPGSQREVIFAELKKRQGTANDLASRTKIPLTTARSILSALKAANRVKVASTVGSGNRSRAIYVHA